MMAMRKRKAASIHALSLLENMLHHIHVNITRRVASQASGKWAWCRKEHPVIIAMAKLGVYNVTQHAAGTTVSKHGRDS